MNKLAIRQTVVSLIILSVSVLAAYGLSNMSNPPEKEQEKSAIPLVRSMVLAGESVRFTIRSQGIVRPSVETSLVAEVSGVVKEVSPVFASGGIFSKGDLLARIDDSDYRVALRQAEANLAASEAKESEERARSEAEKQSWLRSGKKLKDAPPLLIREPYLAEARAKVKASKAQLEKALRDLERTIIRAPYDGIVRERKINLGQFVSNGAQTGSVYSSDFAEVRLPIKSSDLAFILDAAVFSC